MAFLAQGTERKEGFGALLLELSHGSAEERALRRDPSKMDTRCLADRRTGRGRDEGGGHIWSSTLCQGDQES